MDSQQVSTVLLHDSDEVPAQGATLVRRSDGQRFVVRGIDGPVALEENGKPVGAIMGLVLDAGPRVLDGDELRAL